MKIQSKKVELEKESIALEREKVNIVAKRASTDTSIMSANAAK